MENAENVAYTKYGFIICINKKSLSYYLFILLSHTLRIIILLKSILSADSPDIFTGSDGVGACTGADEPCVDIGADIGADIDDGIDDDIDDGIDDGIDDADGSV